MTVAAHISHALPGRLRIRVPDKRGDTKFFSQVGDTLAGVDGVKSLDTNPLTGSILIQHEQASSDGILEAARRAALFELHTPADQNGPPAEDRIPDSASITGLFSRMRIPALDARTVLIVLFLVLAIRQMIRGQVMVPALSLLWYAFDLTRNGHPMGAPGADHSLE